MKLSTIMDRIQQADWDLTMIVPTESYDFAIDINSALRKMGHYSCMYYDKCDAQGLTYKEATDKLGEHLRNNLGIIAIPKEQTA